MNAAFFIEHQTRFIKAVDGALVVLTAYDSLQLSGDMVVPFLQEANFWWLTGINEAGWRLIIDGTTGQVTLVRPRRSSVQELFDGGMDDRSVEKRSGIARIIPAAEFEPLLRQLARKHTMVQTVHDDEAHDFVVNPAQRVLFDTLTRTFPSVVDCSRTLNELRALKSPAEIKKIETAGKLTCDTFALVRERIDNYRYEYEMEADFTHAFRAKNAQHAYEPIVAGGKNAVTLHYTNNSEKLKQHSLVLIDIGARVNGYCADVTRTYGINPTSRQRAVHAAVVAAQKQIINLIKPDLLVADYLRQVDEIMKDALQTLGLLDDRDDTETYRQYFPHAISHGLGVDVHDSLGNPRYFRAGMVLTVEPGIYIAEESIGVRIEDDILVTETGHKNLTGHLSTAL